MKKMNCMLIILFGFIAFGYTQEQQSSAKSSNTGGDKSESGKNRGDNESNSDVNNDSGYFNLHRTLSSLPSMIKDSAMKEKICSLPLNPYLYLNNTVNDDWKKSTAQQIQERQAHPEPRQDTYIKKQLGMSEYVDFLAGSSVCRLENIKKVSDLKHSETTYKKIVDALDKNKNKVNVQNFTKELSNDDNCYYVFPAEGGCAAEGPRVFIFVCKSGLIIADVTEEKNEACIIDSEILDNISRIDTKFTKDYPFKGQYAVSGAYIYSKNEKYEVPTLNNEKDLAEKLYEGYNYFNAFKNINVISKSVFKASVKSESKDKLMGYNGLAIGMNQDDALQIVRGSVDYTKYDGLLSIQCDTPSQLKESGLKEEAKEYLRDIQVATKGLILTPPWKMFILIPKQKESYNNPECIPGDVFVFADNRLAIAGRYLRVKPDGSKYLGHEQIGTGADNVELETLNKKYGSPSSFNILQRFRDNGYSYDWLSENLCVGAVFVGGYKLNLEKNSLQMTDRLPSIKGKVILDDPSTTTEPRMLIPFNTNEVVFMENGYTGDKAAYLKYIYYWNSESAHTLQEREINYLNNTKKATEDSKQSKINSNTDNL